MSNETARWALYKQYDEVNQNFRTVWRLHLSFYTAILAINFAALGFVHGSAALSRSMGWVIFAFSAMNLLVAASSVFLLSFTNRAVGQVAAVARDIAEFARSQGEALNAGTCFRQTLLRDLCHWAAGANIAAMLLMTLAWIATSATALGSAAMWLHWWL